jgi:transcriptional regulator with XRE-family HTH domain
MIHEDWLPEYIKRRPQIIQELKESYGNYRQLISVLRLTRESYDLHQEQLAAIMGKKQPAITKLENGVSNPSFCIFMKYAYILGYDVQLLRKMGDEDELSLFHIRRFDIARMIPHDVEKRLGFPLLELNEDAINKKASDIIRHLSEIRTRREAGLSTLCQEYTRVRNTSPPLEIPNLSIKQMANELGVSHMTIRRFEQGDTDSVTTEMVFRYADRLNLWLSLSESRFNPKEEAWEHFVLTCGMLHKTAEMILEKEKDDGM